MSSHYHKICLQDFDMFVTDLIGNYNIPGKATTLYDINFVGVYSGNAKWRMPKLIRYAHAYELHMDQVSFLIPWEYCS